jgi:hypothetical protein
MARPDGVVIVSERFWAFAGVDGSLREGTMPSPPRPLRRVPLLRGIVRLAASLSPVLRRSGVARPRERVLLIGTLVAPLGFFLLPERLVLPVSLALGAALVAWMLRGRTLFLHGAEHRAIAAAETGRLVETWDGAVKPTRFAARCGTNFAALAILVAAVAEVVWPFPAAAYSQAAGSMIALGLTMELWQAVHGRARRWLKPLLLPGLGLQRLTTREPSLAETRVALRAAASVLERELPR